MKCDDLQDMLLDYVTHGLGAARAAVVHEHLKKCEHCRRAAAEIRAIVRLLHDAARTETGAPDRLSQDSRTRLLRAFMHPIFDWVYRHHLAVSIAVAIVVAAILLCRALTTDDRNPPPPPGIEITIGNGAPGGTNADGTSRGARPLPPRQNQERTASDGANTQER